MIATFIGPTVFLKLEMYCTQLHLQDNQANLQKPIPIPNLMTIIEQNFIFIQNEIKIDFVL